jgi:hypothetical protein
VAFDAADFILNNSRFSSQPSLAPQRADYLVRFGGKYSFLGGKVRISNWTLVSAGCGAAVGVGFDGVSVFGVAVVVTQDAAFCNGSSLRFGQDSQVSLTRSSFLFVNGSNPVVHSRGSLTITNSNFSHNSVYFNATAACLLIEAPTGPVEITNCTFEHNFANGEGAAATVAGGSSPVAFRSCIFSHNFAYGIVGAGATVAIAAAQGVEITDSIFFSNVADADGVAKQVGVIFSVAGGVSVFGCVFSENSCARCEGGAEGGAVGLDASTARIERSKFGGNRGRAGVGLLASRSRVDVKGCTFEVGGGGIAV